jgi:hypothetical protein
VRRGPGDPLIGLGSVGISTGILVGSLGGEVMSRVVARRVRRHGSDATATIVSVTPTGMTINDIPQVRVTLRVEPADGRAAYEADLRTGMSTPVSLRPGERVAVRYDPARPSRVALVEGATAGAPGPGGPRTSGSGTDAGPSGDCARTAHDQETVLAPMGIPDPTVGLYSATMASKGAVLTQMVFDRLNDIITGRAPFSAYDQLVSDWRSQGGDQARKEFQDAVQKARG